MAYNMGAMSEEELRRLREQQANQPPVQQPVQAYTPNQTVQDYKSQVNTMQGQKPGIYTSKYQAGIDQLFDKILNRGKFEYDMNADKLYKQAMDKYSQQAKMGMQDTMGQAQAMTGGYGNSYAQTAGQQMYDKTMQNVTDMLPAMEERAYSRWSGEGDDMARNLAMTQNLEQDEYGRHRDAIGDWRFDTDKAFERYNTERGFDYGQYMDKVNTDFNQSRFDYDKYTDSRDFEYGKGRDEQNDAFLREKFEFEKGRALSDDEFRQAKFDYEQSRDVKADSQWDKQFEYGKSRDEVADSRWDKQFEYGKDRDEKDDAFLREKFEYEKGRAITDDEFQKEKFEYEKDRNEKDDAFLREKFEFDKGRALSDQEFQQAKFEYQKSLDDKDEAWRQLQWDTQQAAASAPKSSGGKTVKPYKFSRDEYFEGIDAFENGGYEALKQVLMSFAVNGASDEDIAMYKNSVEQSANKAPQSNNFKTPDYNIQMTDELRKRLGL